MKRLRMNKNRYLEIVDRFTSEGIRGNFSVKPTMFGLLIDEEKCYEYIREVVRLAADQKYSLSALTWRTPDVSTGRFRYTAV
jgi:proline dehydrogenase